MTAANHVAPITQIAERLRKLVLLLSSDQDGEVVGAARAIGRALAAATANTMSFAASTAKGARRAGIRRDLVTAPAYAAANLGGPHGPTN